MWYSYSFGSCCAGVSQRVEHLTSSMSPISIRSSSGARVCHQKWKVGQSITCVCVCVTVCCWLYFDRQRWPSSQRFQFFFRFSFRCASAIERVTTENKSIGCGTRYAHMPEWSYFYFTFLHNLLQSHWLIWDLFSVHRAIREYGWVKDKPQCPCLFVDDGSCYLTVVAATEAAAAWVTYV